jgi:hypothetical protein
MRFLITPFLLTAAASFAADLPPVPAQAIAKKKELLFSDDFERTELGKGWQQVVPTFGVENGALKGTQTRVNAPAADGKPAVVGHQAVAGNDIPTKDSVIEFRFRFAGATAVSAEFDDRKYTGSHYGHICMARVTPESVILIDQSEGSMRNDIIEMSKDPAKKDERNKLLVGRSATYPVKLDPEKWHTFVLETVGDTMRVTVDGTPAGFLKSPGIAHRPSRKSNLDASAKTASSTTSRSGTPRRPNPNRGSSPFFGRRTATESLRLWIRRFAMEGRFILCC